MELSHAVTTLTLAQALQLVGLAPSLFLVVFLLSLAVRDRQALIPALYFLSLSCAFARPLLALYPGLSANHWVAGGLLFGESVLVAVSFLLIMQFMLGRLPPAPYWLVLAIPLVGGGSLMYASMIEASGNCTPENCPDIVTIKTLYNIFSSSLVFLLLVYYSSRLGGRMQEDMHKRHKYWLVIALILLHLCVLAVDLARVAERITIDEAQFASAMFRLAFIYLVITSLFRVFYPMLVSQVIQGGPATRQYHPDMDKPHVEKLKMLLDAEKVWKEMRLNRAALAKKVGINEHHLSRVINGHFGKNFNELMNGYRIEEAKRRLKSEPTQITTIAFETGFNSIASFNRVFKEKVGQSPTEFRNSANKS